MYVDILLRVCNAQAFTGLAVSTDSIDLSNVTPKREIATGEAMGFGVAVIAAASATTVLVELIHATNGPLSAGVVVLSQRTFLGADMPAGALIFMPLPQNFAFAGPLQFLGLRVTPAGGAATVTLTAWLTAHDLFSVAARSYAKNFTVSI